MKHILAVLITAFTFLVMGHSSAATIGFTGKSLDSVQSPLVCDKEKEKDKKKKKGADDEEPECD